MFHHFKRAFNKASKTVFLEGEGPILNSDSEKTTGRYSGKKSSETI